MEENLLEIAPYEPEIEEDEVINFSSPEKVIFLVIRDPKPWRRKNDWPDYSVDDIIVVGKDGIMGAASYEQSYSGFLDYVIEGMCTEITKEGWYVLDNFTGDYTRGDFYTTDDTMDFYSDDPRPATPEEIDEHCPDWHGGDI